MEPRLAGHNTGSAPGLAQCENRKVKELQPLADLPSRRSYSSMPDAVAYGDVPTYVMQVIPKPFQRDHVESSELSRGRRGVRTVPGAPAAPTSRASPLANVSMRSARSSRQDEAGDNTLVDHLLELEASLGALCWITDRSRGATASCCEAGKGNNYHSRLRLADRLIVEVSQRPRH
jgi:hypothetical protein